MLYDLSRNYHILEEKKIEAIERFKNDDSMLNWIKNKSIDNTLYEFEKGIYETGGNFNHTLGTWFGIVNIQEYGNFYKWELSYDKKYFYPMIGSKMDYGVCDNYQQVLDRYPEIITNQDEYIISMYRIVRANQPSKQGWRWHKWGAYIGNHKKEHEYLYDEIGIEEVFCYHIYKIVTNLRKYTGRLKWLNYKDLEGRRVDLEKISKIDGLKVSAKIKRELYFNRED